MTLLTSFNVLDKFNLHTSLTDNPYDFAPSDLFEVGARVNPKRHFLFVSRLIGKHLDVHPDIPKATGVLLAHLFVKKMEEPSSFEPDPLVAFIKKGVRNEQTSHALQLRHALKEEDKTLFIGFAETATGLGHSVFSSFNHAYFIHTTRETVPIASLFDFKEEHSHAVDHRCYLKDETVIKDAKHVVLIDDEMTTGKTSLNLIRSLHAIYPKKRYTILCLLDWRNKEEEQAYEKMEKELGVTISVVSLTKGTIQVSNNYFFEHANEETLLTPIASYHTSASFFLPKMGFEKTDYLLYTGRFGLSSKEHDAIEQSAKEIGKKLKKMRGKNKTLVLGVGEFMYIPSRIAAYMGENVAHKTTTRSPIYSTSHPLYPFHSRITFTDDDGVTNHVYNVKEQQYEDIFIVSEKTISPEKKEEMTACFVRNEINNITFVTL